MSLMSQETIQMTSRCEGTNINIGLSPGYHIRSHTNVKLGDAYDGFLLSQLRRNRSPDTTPSRRQSSLNRTSPMTRDLHKFPLLKSWLDPYWQAMRVTVRSDVSPTPEWGEGEMRVRGGGSIPAAHGAERICHIHPEPTRPNKTLSRDTGCREAHTSTTKLQNPGRNFQKSTRSAFLSHLRAIQWSPRVLPESRLGHRGVALHCQRAACTPRRANCGCSADQRTASRTNPVRMSPPSRRHPRGGELPDVRLLSGTRPVMPLSQLRRHADWAPRRDVFATLLRGLPPLVPCRGKREILGSFDARSWLMELSKGPFRHSRPSAGLAFSEQQALTRGLLSNVGQSPSFRAMKATRLA